MSKRSIILSVALLLGLCYLWPWAVRKKVKQLQLEAETRQTRTVGSLPEKKYPGDSPTRLLFPVQGKGTQDVISFFGDPRAQGQRRHEGVDIAADRGTAVVAVADGVVDRVKSGGDGGKQVWLRLDNDWLVYYAHLHTQTVASGVRVAAGDVIGTVGNTGNARFAGPHLHFCLYPEANQPVDPMHYLPGQLALP